MAVLSGVTDVARPSPTVEPPSPTLRRPPAAALTSPASVSRPPPSDAALFLYAPFVTVVALTFASSPDDPFVTLRYAANLVHGYGLAFNRGQHVQGFTSPLHLLVAVVAYLTPGGHDLFKLKVASLVFGLLAVREAGRLLYGVALPRWARRTGCLAVATSWVVAFSSSNGLETTLVMWLLMVLARRLVIDGPRRSPPLAFPAFLRRCPGPTGRPLGRGLHGRRQPRHRTSPGLVASVFVVRWGRSGRRRSHSLRRPLLRRAVTQHLLRQGPDPRPCRQRRRALPDHLPPAGNVRPRLGRAFKRIAAHPGGPARRRDPRRPSAPSAQWLPRRPGRRPDTLHREIGRGLDEGWSLHRPRHRSPDRPRNCSDSSNYGISSTARSDRAWPEPSSPRCRASSWSGRPFPCGWFMPRSGRSTVGSMTGPSSHRGTTSRFPRSGPPCPRTSAASGRANWWPPARSAIWDSPVRISACSTSAGLTNQAIARSSPAADKNPTGVDDPDWFLPSSPVGRVLLRDKPALIATFDTPAQNRVLGGAYRLSDVTDVEATPLSFYVPDSSPDPCAG